MTLFVRHANFFPGDYVDTKHTSDTLERHAIVTLHQIFYTTGKRSRRLIWRRCITSGISTFLLSLRWDAGGARLTFA